MTDEELATLVNCIAAEAGMGGLDVGTLYGDFALNVAKAVREECARAVETAGAYTEWVEEADFCAAGIRG
jgi:ubiquinone/menaquinone biosynthesis C-methylase UbiE